MLSLENPFSTFDNREMFFQDVAATFQHIFEGNF
jgi:hypothetical protein